MQHLRDRNQLPERAKSPRRRLKGCGRAPGAAPAPAPRGSPSRGERAASAAAAATHLAAGGSGAATASGGLRRSVCLSAQRGGVGRGQRRSPPRQGRLPGGRGSAPRRSAPRLRPCGSGRARPQPGAREQRPRGATRPHAGQGRVGWETPLAPAPPPRPPPGSPLLSAPPGGAAPLLKGAALGEVRGEAGRWVAEPGQGRSPAAT